MFMAGKTSFFLFSFLASGLLFAPQAAQASDITLEGLFTHDDDVQLFDVTVATPGLVDIRTYGYAGGMTSTGTMVSPGGFDTVLTLFNGTGVFLADNDEGSGVATDPSTGEAFDARITIHLTPASYIVALTQFDNLSLGNLADGFAETGHPNFTADPTFTTGGPCPGNLFRDISGTAGRCRTGSWAVDFVNVASVTPAAPVPEPGTFVLLCAGLLGVGLFWKRRSTVALLAVLAAGTFCVRARAQEPDYSNVNDILDGQRTLLNIDDLMLSGVNKGQYGLNGRLSILKLTTANSQPIVGPSMSSNAFFYRMDTLTFTGHMANMSAETLAVVSKADAVLAATLSFPAISSQNLQGIQLPGSINPAVSGGAMADFNRDGYDDLVVGFSNGVLDFVTAKDVNNINNGVTLLERRLLEGSLAAITVGDFNGDGQPDIAGLLQLPSGGLALVIYTVNPKTFEVSKAAQITLEKAGTGPIGALSIASGRFTPEAHDQIIVASTPKDVVQTTLELIDFPPSSLTPQEKTTYAFKSGFLSAGGIIQVKTGKFGLPTNRYDQVAFMFAWHGYPSPNGKGHFLKYLDVLVIDPATLTWKHGQLYEFSDQDCAYGITVGNYDHRQPDPAHPGQTQHDFNDQIALLAGSCNKGSRNLRIINVDPANSTPSVASSIDLPSSINNWTGLSLTESDTQGRSYALGEPAKVVISDTDQPTVVAAMPPMHVDFIPAAGETQPTVLNVSAIPRGFHTFYETTSEEKNESSTTNTTSWSFGAKQRVEASVEVGSVENGFGAKASAAVSAAQDLKGVTETEHGSYKAKNFSAKVETGFADHVWYEDTRFNIYVYPVIGKTVCPATESKCAPGEQVPLTIQFSGPDHTSYEDVDGNIIPWYQPPWEPGNLFSYPATYAQLRQIVPNIDKLSEDNTWRTDGSTLTQETRWTTEATNGSSASFDQNYSFDSELSVTGACCGGLVTGSLTAQLSLSGSSGFSDLNKAIASVGKSTGIGVTKPGTFLTPTLYSYPVTPYIFGEKAPGSKLDDTPLDSDVETSGILRTAFVADPARNDAGGWWRQEYTSAPDVALNHPSRWEMVSVGLENPIPSNCRQAAPQGSTMDCARRSPSYPDNPWLSVFQSLRGFFISSALKPGKGPQLTTAREGDKLTLQVRVYNYSLAPMTADTRVHVRFYVQPFNEKNNKPIGGSVLINNQDVVLSPIPPFSDDDGAPLNWVLASTNFDTAPYAGQYLTFWVVVWMEDGSAKLVPEIAGHGLKSIPGELTSLAGVQTEEYSNNVGFYHSKFYVFPKQPALEASLLSGEPATIDIGKIQLSTSRTFFGQSIDVSAPLSATGNSASGVTAVFYDGDPHAGGRAFGLELSPYIAENGTYQVEAPYQANTCGTHELFIVVHKDAPDEILRRAPTVRIDCSAVGSSLKQ